MQVDEACLTVDAVRFASCCCQTAVNGLANLANHNKIIFCTSPECAEEELPWMGQEIVRPTKHIAYL
jgi:hypothetical protein